MLTGFYSSLLIGIFIVSANPQPLSRIALLEQEGGCVFIVEEGYPPFMLEFTSLTHSEKKFASNPVKAGYRLEGILEEFLATVSYSMRKRSETAGNDPWEEQVKLLEGNFGTIFIPAITAQLKKAKPGKKVRFAIGEGESITAGYIFIGNSAIHLVIEKIKGSDSYTGKKPTEAYGWKLKLKPPLSFQKRNSGSGSGTTLYNRIVYPVSVEGGSR